MKTNRISNLSAIGIAGLVFFIAVRMLCMGVQGSGRETIPPTLAESTPLEVTPIIPKNTELGEINIAGTPGTANRLRINLDAYPQVLDPQKAVLPKEIAFLNLVYEGLTRLDENLKPVPAAAERWQYNAAATELTFTLREGLTYSDGSPLNAMRFEAALQRLVDPATGSAFAWLVEPVREASQWHAADPNAPGYDRQGYIAHLGIQAQDLAGQPCDSYSQSDCRVLKLEFTQPAPAFHYVMGLWATYPVRMDLLTDDGIDWWLQRDKRVGNGPFVLMDLEPFIAARFAPNPAYRDPAPLTALEFYFINDPDTALQAFRNNRLEVIAPDNTAVTGSLQQTDGQFIATPGACTSMVLFGLQPLAEGVPSPFSDLKVRQAFAMSFDAQGWIRDVDAGRSSYGGTFIPWGFPGYAGVTQPYPFNPEQARQVLAESSYGSAQALNALGLTLTFADTPQNQARYTWLSDNFRTHLGVELSLDPRPAGEYAALQAEAGYAPLLDVQGWCALYPDPYNWLVDYWGAGSHFRPGTGYDNPALQALLEQASTLASEPERIALYTQAHQLLLEDAPAIFGLASANHYLVKPWVKWVNSPFDSVWPGSLFPERVKIER